MNARILWPALGCPAVIAPRAGGGPHGGVQRRITLLLVSDRERLGAAEVAAHLRVVPWAARARRSVAAAPTTAFAIDEVRVRDDVPAGTLMAPRHDDRGEAVVFGAARYEDSVAASLSRHVRRFYAAQGLRHLHEVTIDEAASARLADGTYHLMWQVPGIAEGRSSAEMALLVDRFARARRRGKGRTPQWRRFHDEHFAFLVDEYRLDYGALHRPYVAADPERRLTEVLHPLFVRREAASALRFAHVTDVHVDVRMDVYEHNLRQAPAPFSWDGARLRLGTKEVRFNNANRSFAALYAAAQREADAIVMTGDLVEYGRGHVGLMANGAYRHRLDDEEAYHVDRNWFLFFYLLASRNNYTRPVYTSLGNHDWRLNPYPPFTDGAPVPTELIHNHRAFSERERRQIIEAAHGPGFDRRLYVEAGPDLVGLFRRGLSFPGSPLETTVESVAWYLLLVNPFLDYALPMPGGQQLLMLDWGKDEDVTQRGSAWALDFGTPSEANVLSDLQRWHVERFVASEGGAKIIGKHAPVLGPFPRWADEDLAAGEVTYNANQARILFPDVRPPITRHSLCAIAPQGAPQRVAAIYAGMTRHRDEFIQRIAPPRAGVRLVLSGHIHRENLLVAYRPRSGSGQLMRSVRPADVPGAGRGAAARRLDGAAYPAPLYVNTGSAGPRPARYTRGGSEHVAPRFHLISLSGDGVIRAIRSVALNEPSSPTSAGAAAPAPTTIDQPRHRELTR